MKNLLRELKNQTFDPIEVKVRDATSSDPWGAPSSLMQEIADATHDYTMYPKLFGMLWKRLRDYQHHMHVHKALLLTEYLIRNGSDRFIRDAQQRADDINKLRRYKYYNAKNEDIAADVRKKAKQVYEMLTDEEKIKEEREKGASVRGKTVGISSRDVPQQRSTRDVQAAGSGDPYDNYSATSRAESQDQPATKVVKKKPTAKAAAAPADDNPFDNAEPETNPFDEQPKPKVVKKVVKTKPKPQPQEEEEYEQPEEAPAAAVPKIAKPKAAARTRSKASPAPEEQDVFQQPPQQQQQRRNNVDDLLAGIAGSGANYGGAGHGAGDFDFLTGQMDNVNMGGGGFADDDAGNQGGGGHVEWGPENDNEEEEEVEQPVPQQQQKGKGAGNNNLWDMVGDFTNLDNIATEKKKQQDLNPKKKEKTMTELAAKRPTVQMGAHIDGFAPANPAPNANPFAASPYVGSNAGYGAAPGYGAPPAYGAMPGYGAAPAYGAPAYGQPAPGYGMPPQAGYPNMGYPPAAQPRRNNGF